MRLALGFANAVVRVLVSVGMGVLLVPDSDWYPGTSCTSQSVDPAAYPAYPSWPRGDHANGNDRMTNGKAVWQANWWTSSEPKAGDGSWKLVCNY